MSLYNTLYRSYFINEHHDPRRRAAPRSAAAVQLFCVRGGFHLRCVASPKRKEEGSSHLVPPRPSSFDCRVAAAVHPPIFFSSFYFLPPNYAVRSEVVRLKAAPLKLHRLRIAVRGSGVLATNPPQEDSRELKFKQVPVSHCQET